MLCPGHLGLIAEQFCIRMFQAADHGVGGSISYNSRDGIRISRASGGDHAAHHGLLQTVEPQLIERGSPQNHAWQHRPNEAAFEWPDPGCFR